MAEVPDHLVPTDGLTNSTIIYGGLDTLSNSGGAVHRFKIRDEQGDLVGTFTIENHPNGKGVDGMIEDAHKRMVDVLRQWLHMTETARKGFASDSSA